jgi:yeast amino acid transporter
MMQSVGELATSYPVPSAFSTWSSQFVDRALGFATGNSFSVNVNVHHMYIGWNYWFLWTIVISAELTGVNTVMLYWTDHVPVAAWISIFLLVLIAFNLFGVRGFGEIETVFTIIKFGFMAIIIIVCAIISGGKAPKGDEIGCSFLQKYSKSHGSQILA